MCPGDELNAVTVGATDSTDLIAYFSSRGPVTLSGQTYIKPDVSAPGVDIISTYPGNRYAYMSGTSMATPHVSGIVALMLEKNPTLTPTQVKQTLESTSIDLGFAGKDNDYGSGRVDAYKAVFGQAALSNDAKLKTLTVSDGTLVPGFSSGTFSYTDSVANSVSSIKFTPTANESHATIKVNGTTVVSGQISQPVTLAVGPNVINVNVTAQDGNYPKSLYNNGNKSSTAVSNDANLSALTVSSGSLNPVFSKGTFSYTDSVANSVSSITFTPTANESHATIKVNGTTVVSGQASQPITLAVGPNVINVNVTAQDAITQKAYTITVTRAAPAVSNDANLSALTVSSGSLNPVFSKGTLSYTDSVANSVSSITFTPTANESHATIKVNGTTVVSGQASQPITLAVGPNVINVNVTAQDAITQKAYTITVTRATAVNGFSNKVILGDTSPVSPALASFNGRLYLAWKGNGNNNLNVMYSTDDGKTFGNKYTSPEKSPESPVLCVHNGSLYIAWKGNSNNKLNVAQIAMSGDKITGFSNKVILGDMSPVSPALASFNGRLYLAWKGNGNNNLNVMYSTDDGKTFGNKYTSPEKSPESPVLCVHKGSLYIAWKGNSNNNLNVAQIAMSGDKITGFSNKVILGDTSPVSPALASFNGRLYLAWKGNGNNNLNVMYSTDDGRTFGNKYTSPEKSPESPVLCVHNGSLYIAWKGNSNNNLNVAQVS